MLQAVGDRVVVLKCQKNDCHSIIQKTSQIQTADSSLHLEAHILVAKHRSALPFPSACHQRCQIRQTRELIWQSAVNQCFGGFPLESLHCQRQTIECHSLLARHWVVPYWRRAKPCRKGFPPWRLHPGSFCLHVCSVAQFLPVKSPVIAWVHPQRIDLIWLVIDTGH